MTEPKDSGEESESALSQAFALLKRGRLDEARTLFADHLNDAAAGVDAHRGLAAIAWQRGQHESSIQLLMEAVRRDERHPDANADLALLLMMSGRYEDSLKHWEIRLVASPDNAGAWHNYGKALFESRRLEEACKAFEHAITRAPSQIGSYVTYAKALEAVRRWSEAEAVWRRGLEHNPGMEAAVQGIATCQFHRGQFEDCLETYRDGISRFPESATLHMGFGQMLGDFGDPVSAESEFRRALALRPGWVFPVEAILALLRANATDVDVTLAKTIIEDEARPPQDKAMAAFGLGKAMDARGDREEAFSAWVKANEFRKQQVGTFDRARLTDYVDRLIATYNAELFEKFRGCGVDDPRPVFVVGMPRSGTTLVEQILSAHPDVYGYGELSEIESMTRQIRSSSGSIQRWPEVVRDASPESIESAASAYLDAQQQRHAAAARRVVDKAPNNFFHLGIISIAFPQARIIWCRRDPRDLCLSIYAENFALNQKHATDLGDLAFYFTEYMRLMRHWLEVLGDRIYSCKYDSMVGDPDASSRSLVAGVGLEWNEACARFHESQRPVLTPSRWQVRRPIYSDSIQRWKRYEEYLGPLLNGLGTQIDY